VRAASGVASAAAAREGSGGELDNTTKAIREIKERMIEFRARADAFQEVMEQASAQCEAQIQTEVAACRAVMEAARRRTCACTAGFGDESEQSTAQRYAALWRTSVLLMECATKMEHSTAARDVVIALLLWSGTRRALRWR
jgi:cytochrome c556